VNDGAVHAWQVQPSAFETSKHALVSHCCFHLMVTPHLAWCHTLTKMWGTVEFLSLSKWKQAGKAQRRLTPVVSFKTTKEVPITNVVQCMFTKTDNITYLQRKIEVCPSSCLL